MPLTVVLFALAAIAPDASSFQVAPNQSPKQSPLVGTWIANLEKSTLHPSFTPQGVTLQIDVAGETATMTSYIRNVAGQEMKAAETFRTDGVETPGTLTPGVSLIARWLGPHVLATLARKGEDVIALITYQVSADGKTLTARSSGVVEQVIVFERR